MATERIFTDDSDLTGILGGLDDDQKATVMETLKATDESLVALRDELAEKSGRSTWESDGVTLELFESGQLSLNAILKDAEQELVFSVELRPKNFFDDHNVWRPGSPPRAMATDGWDVEGDVQVMTEQRVAGRKYKIMETVAELEEQRYNDPVEAVQAFAARTEELAALARSRDPEAAAWRPELKDEEPPSAL